MGPSTPRTPSAEPPPHALDHLELSIVIPAFREGAKIQRDVCAAVTFLQRFGLRGEVIVVDDGSDDDTATQAERAAAEVATLPPAVRVLSYLPQRGKGHALRTGVGAATGAVIMFADAGLCVPYEAARIGLAMLETGVCDIAHGSRRQGLQVVRAQPLHRRLGSLAYLWVMRLWMQLPAHLKDTQCGFKLYRREVAHQLFGAAVTDGFMLDIELICRALSAGYRILEFAVPWSADPDTRYHPVWGTLRNLRELVALKRTLALQAKQG
jgi:dolichyl-phosphate beta-glucosyltransferase